MSSNIISEHGFIPIILQEQMPLKNGVGLPSDPAVKSTFLSELNKFLYNFAEKKEKDNTEPSFKYVGLLEYPTNRQNYMLYFMPKYYDMRKIKSANDILNNESDTYKHFRLILKTINKYRREKFYSSIKESRLQTQAGTTEDDVFNSNKLAIAVTLIEDYLQNGVYTNMKKRRSLCGNGEIDWHYTINTTNPVIQDDVPYYFNYWTTDRIPDTETTVARLHKAIIKNCSIALSQWGLDKLLELETPTPYDGELSDFGDKESIVAIINRELSVQFITRKQNSLKLMRTYIELENISVADGVSIFGTGSFHAVWEKVCSSVFGSQLDEQIAPGMLPEEMKEKQINKWSDIEARAKWYINNDKTIDAESQNEKEANKLRPDFVALNMEKQILYILDAKYYIPVFSGNGVKDAPGVGDINKQHLYQLAYQPLISKNNWRVINAFLLPESAGNSNDFGQSVKAFCSIFDDIQVKDKKGNMFSFTKIQTLFLNPENLFQNYLTGNNEHLNNKMLDNLMPDNVIK